MIARLSFAFALVLVSVALLLACAGSSISGAVRRGQKLTDQARYEEALPVLQAAVARAEALAAPSLDRAHAFYALGDLYLQSPPLADPGEAEALLARACAEYEGVLGARHPSVGLVLVRMAELARDRGRASEAAALEQRANEIFLASLPPEHPVRAYLLAGTGIPMRPEEVAHVRFASAAQPGAGTSIGDDRDGEDAPAVVGVDGTFLKPNAMRPDGTRGYVHVTEADMPLVVSIGNPKWPPKFASRKEARQRSIEAIQMWEKAIQPHLPWFRVVFVEDDPNAAVQIEWKRRLSGGAVGWGRMTWSGEGESLRVGGDIQISTTPDNYTILEIDDLDVLVTHEFGHVLGLRHCLDCDSAMNYSWQTRGRVFVTELDVQTFLALVAQPNAY